MVAPFKPYELIENIRDGRYPTGSVYVYKKTQRGVKQAGPFVNTAYYLDVMRRLSGERDCGSWSVSPDGAAVEARNKARAKFVDKLGDSSSFGATLTAERKATWGTVVDTITRAGLAAKAVSRGKFGKAANYLGIEPPQKFKKLNYGKVSRKNKLRRKSVLQAHYTTSSVRDGSKSFGNKWLWYSYGVKPLMQDIYNGMDVLQRPTPEMKVLGFGKSQNILDTTYWKYTWTSSVKCSATVWVKNPNLWLANQLGLVNPIQWINEGIPFSFVIDWFSNLSQVINQMTDFVGLEIADPITAEKHTVIDEQKYPFSPEAKEWYRFERILSIPQAKLVFAYERFSWQRGANAVSLLLQFLPSKR